jgi:nucleoside-diphosphate-sugar epimerase
LAHRVPRTGAEGALFFQVNVEGTKNLLRALERTDKLPEAVVLISTVAVYGREEGMQLDETTPRKAIEPYGASKREAEDFLMAWCSRHGVRAGVVRLPLVAGSNAPGNLGAMVGALRKGTYLGIGSGAARRSMVMASDVAQVLPEVARAGGVYNLTDGYHPSFMEFETALANAMGRRAPRRLPLRVARLGARLGDVVQKTIGINVPFTSRTLTKMSSTLTLSDERARKELGWSPSPVLDHARELTKGHESWVAGK